MGETLGWEEGSLFWIDYMTCAAWVQVLVFTQSVNWSYHEDFSNEFNPRYSSHDIYDVHWFRFVCLFVCLWISKHLGSNCRGNKRRSQSWVSRSINPLHLREVDTRFGYVIEMLHSYLYWTMDFDTVRPLFGDYTATSIVDSGAKVSAKIITARVTRTISWKSMCHRLSGI